jgi:hypothetical protein
MNDRRELMIGTIKTGIGVMRARKDGSIFWVSLGSGIKVGDPFEHDGENYIAHEVFDGFFNTEIVAWRAW